MDRARLVDEYWYSIDWDVEAIWALDLPVEDMDVARFLWIMDVPIWPLNGVGYQITPTQVMNAPEQYAVEFARVNAASLKYPIDVYFNKDRWMILDGVHRLAKALSLGKSKMRVRVVPKAYIKDLRH